MKATNNKDNVTHALLLVLKGMMLQLSGPKRYKLHSHRLVRNYYETKMEGKIKWKRLTRKHFNGHTFPVLNCILVDCGYATGECKLHNFSKMIIHHPKASFRWMASVP